MNQVHLCIGKRRSDHTSIASALDSVKTRIIANRFLYLLDDEVIAMLRFIFLL